MPKKHSTNGQHHPHAPAELTPAVAPTWVRVANELRAAITSGHYGPGALLPSTAELCQQYEISTTTARRVLNQLVAEGLAEARRGRGHIVIRPHPRRAHPVRRYNPSDGPPPRDLTSQLIATGPTSAPPDVAALLDLDPGHPLYLHTTLLTDPAGTPAELCHAYAIPDADPHELRAILDAGHPWTDALRKATGRQAAYASAVVSARQATPDEAGLLGMPPTAAVVLVTDTLTYDLARRPLALLRSLLPAERTALTDYYQVPDDPR